MSFDVFQAEMDQQGIVSDALSEFAEFYFSNGSVGVPEFSLVGDGRKCALAWFANDFDKSNEFAVFGRTNAGSLFAFWKPEINETTNKTPIVFLASECQGSSVICDSIENFLICLAFGSDDFETDIEYSESENWDGILEEPFELNQFRQWVNEKRYTKFSGNPKSIVVQARKNNKNLMNTIEEWQARIF